MWPRASIAFFFLCACDSDPASLPRPGGTINNRPIQLGQPLPLARPSASALAIAPKAPDEPVLRVTPYDVLIERPGAKVPVFSYAEHARAAFERDVPSLATGDAGVPLTVREIDVTPVAWVGPLLSLRERTVTNRPDHPDSQAPSTRLVTLRIDEKAPPGSRAVVASLTDYADEELLFRELLKEPRVKKALRGSDKPARLRELVATLAKKEPELGKYCSSFPPDLLQRFSIDHVVGEHLVVHLAFEASDLCTETEPEVGVFVPTPPSLSTALADAKAGRAGFLAIDKPQGLTNVHLRLTTTDAK